MNISQIEDNLQKIKDSFSKETFIYDLMLAYGLPKASITRLRNGNLNLSKADNEISWKKKVLFKEVFDQDLHLAISSLVNDVKHDQRFVIVTDYKTILAVDTKTQDKLDIELKDLPKHYDFFLPWAGMEKTQHQNENPADVKAAEKMAKLFDEIKKENPDESPEFIHGLNVFLCRLLFCYFAEDTNIFEEGQFTNAVASRTQTDGNDLDTYLDKLFEVLNTPENDRKNLPVYLNAFPYVNGGLFKKRLQIPKFTRRSRQAIIDSGDLDWSVINPDIFGSMMQAVISPEQRGGFGMHYTSVPNIMRVMEPLFLNDLKEAFEKAKGNQKKRNELLKRLQSVKIFDPACGSGNFLIIAYKKLRKLEMEIFKEQRSSLPISGISLGQFYGIELDDFAHEITQLSLWLAEHQMNVEFFKEFGYTNPTLPLKEAGHIVQGNACRIDWEEVCPKNKGDEIYIMGNPPYLGYSLQSKEQKGDMSIAFEGQKNYRNLDYISCWFWIATLYMKKHNIKSAFVSTNSIIQGEQVPTLWPKIFANDIEIDFAHQSFKWTNSAKGNAGVTCVIIGLRNKSKNPKTLYSEKHAKNVLNISPYLTEGDENVVVKRSSPLSVIPKILRGSGAVDGGYLIMSQSEKIELLTSANNSSKYIRPFIGASELLNGEERYCLWITDENLDEAIQIDSILKRIQNVKDFRLKSKKKATQALSSLPYKFGEIRYKETNCIIIPRVSSERREYIPVDFLDSNFVISDSALAVYDAEPFHFGLITSKTHNVWLRATGGRLETRIRYSALLCYNTFPFPPISDKHKQEITQCAFRILEEREKHSEKTLSELYDSDKMPDGLREAHRLNDMAVDRCYRSKPFENDEERLEYLFNLYEKMTIENQENDILKEEIEMEE
jgi:hypothetical protein